MEEEKLDICCRVDAIAEIFGVSVRRVQQLTQEGIIETVQTKNGNRMVRRYDLVPTLQKYISHLSEKASGKGSEKEAKLKNQKLEAEIALKESQGELHRMKTDIAAGKLIDVEEIQMDYERFLVVFKKFALSLPSRVSGIVGGHCDPVEVRGIEKDLHKEITRILENFVVAGQSDKPPKEAARGRTTKAKK